MLDFKQFAELFIDNYYWYGCIQTSTWSDFEKVCEVHQAFELYKLFNKAFNISKMCTTRIVRSTILL